MRGKTIVTAGLTAALLFGAAATVRAEGSPELDARIGEAQRVLAEALTSNDQSIPEELLAKAKAIAVYPRMLNGAFIVGGSFGKGVVLAHGKDGWGPLAFSTFGGGSFGLQIGGQASDVILVILNDRGLNGLLSDSFTLGADASIAAGPVGRKHEAGTDLLIQASIISYARSVGVFAGVALDGAIVTQDNRSNTEYYGKPTTSREILQGTSVEPAESSKAIISELNEYSTRWDKRGGLVNDRPADPEAKPDLTGLVTGIDLGESRIVIMTDRSAEEKTGQAEVRVTAERTQLTGLQTGDHVKVFLDGQGKDKRALRVVKVD